MITLFKGGHVYAVVEFGEDPVLHGIFSKREYAEGKKEKLKSRHGVKNYIAILKKSVSGGYKLG